MNSDYDHLFKVLILGPSGAGKSSVLTRYVDDTFSSSYVSTIGVDFKLKTVQNVENGIKKTIKLQIWDTAGQERFRTIVSTYYRGAHACFLVYDITNEASFMELRQWYEELLANTTTFSGTEQSNSLKIILVGNKNDLKAHRKVTPEMGQAFADELQVPFFEINAKYGDNIEIMFKTLVDNLVNYHHIEKVMKKKFGLLPRGRPLTKKFSCCN